MDAWPLPPDVPWPQFLRLLRRPDPPEGWLEAAAAIPDLRRRPMLMRWIAQHRRCPAHLRATLLPRMPWRPLATLCWDPMAHPHAVAYATEKLLSMWPGLTTGERRDLASQAPRPLWPLVWKVRDEGVLHAFLRHPRLPLESLQGLIQPPLTSPQIEALQRSKWREVPSMADQVLQAMDRTLQLPDQALVLGMAAPWIKALEPDARLFTASRLTFPPLRRLVRAWAGHTTREALIGD